MTSETKTNLTFGGIILILFIFLVATSILGSYKEAKAYNKLTGANVSTWDAMWVELRIEGHIKEKE